ncbi:S-adenosyl-L-methionine-dependent methyltransferase [Coprinopsis marcescibilis]|uniref:Protein-lysine N-methyltransferase EFM4 n=1 Tax=Coprinopsis marcescibilis TaxID=230819 RepID=A0A5C3KZ53_COPMA|nr:S-adenosyl-L-methionine-dependent methyltransferase [Coprinopsis marcescibilis]
MATEELNPSKLGTKEHWDQVYELELNNFEEIGEEGEIWFGENSVEKMVDWALDHLPPSENPTILEVGSGNGTLLFGLSEAGYEQTRLAGVDYSEGAVRLAHGIAEQREASSVSFRTCNFLGETPAPLPCHDGSSDTQIWDLLLDKGTYDAIALGPKDEQGRSPARDYPKRVVRLLKPGGIFLITSCNFTEAELKASFCTSETGLVYHSNVRHPTITFGGQTGSSIVTVAFQKPALV